MFSKTTEYALRATIYLAQNSSEENKIGIKEISEAIDSPLQYTAKILQLLTKEEKVVSSVRGPNGGFFISEKAKILPIRAVLEAVGEDGILTKCVLGLRYCSESNSCPMHEEYKGIRMQLVGMFSNKTIHDLASGVSKGDWHLKH